MSDTAKCVGLAAAYSCSNCGREETFYYAARPDGTMDYPPDQLCLCRGLPWIMSRSDYEPIYAGSDRAHEMSAMTLMRMIR